PDHTYTVSAWGYIKTPPAPFRNIGMRLTRQQGGADVAFASALLDTTKTNQWQELRFGAVPGSDAINAPKLFLVADAGAEVFWDDISIADGAGSGMRPYGEGGLTYLRWTDETKPTLSCTKDEVGCTLYTPENGDPAKAGIVRQSDLCPNQCVGYATFTEQAPQNKFDVSRDVSLIPSTAKSCQTEDVGCDEFTNLDEVAKGGEGLTYFTEIRQCQKPAPVSTDCAPFYTYEGSASSGAQLQSYVLKASGTLDPATTDGSTTCNRSDANCRDFINAQGKHSFRDMRTTVTCSNDCIPFRKTRSTATQCQATGGEWNGNACTYDVIKSEGKQCRREVNGCRSYVGNTGHVLKTVARTDFERGKPAEWQSQKAVSPEAVRPGGHSLPLEPQEIATWTLPNDTMKTGARYTIYFLAKQETAFPNNAITFTVHVKNSGATTQTFTQNISAAGWHDYTVGPIVASQQSGWTLELQSSAALFIDDVLIRRTNDQYTLIQDSWNTPTTCTPATIGCQAYRTGSNDRLSFSRLTNSCAFEKVGCSAFIDTQNSTSPFSETWNAGDKAEAKTGADVITYLINRPDYACRQEERGCTALETFAPGKNGKLESKTTFLRDDPDLYPSILCASKSEGCSTYVGDGGPHYFKDPKNQFCEYRGIPGSKSFDWFKKGVINLQPDCPRVGWAKQCPSNQSRCTKFVDPLDVTTLHPNGYDYFALKNDSLDTSSCGTNVNRKAGCVLLQDTSSTSTTYSAAHTIEGSGSPMSTCVNANASRVTALNIVTRPNEQTLEFGGMKNVSVVAPIDAIAIEMKPKFVDYGSYMVEFEAKPRRLIGQVGSATVRVALETVAPGATSAPSLTPAPPAPSVNLLSNGGFEEGDEGKLPTDWRETVADSFIKSRPSAPRAQSSTPANDFIGREEATTQQVKARTRFTNVLSQQMYTMSAWAYIQTAPTGNGGVEARFVQEQGGRAIIVAQGQVDTSKVNEWQEVRFTARTSAGTIDEVRAELIVDPGGVVFWDDVSITLPVQTPIGGTTSTVPPAARRGGGTIPVGTALVSPGGWNRYVVGPVKVNRAADMTGRVVLDIPSDVVAIERVAVTLACDANVIMKVTRDRTCGEWLYCKSSVYQVDSAGEYREVCTELGRCKEANPDNPQECKTPVPTTFGEKVFSRAFYQYDPAAGHVGWAGLDYTGYSIPNIYPVETLRQITRSPTKLTFVEKGANTCKIDRDCGDPKNGNLCLNNICYKNKGIDGSEQETARKEKECRLYPDAASPLPSTLGNWTDTDIRPSPPPASAAKIYADWAKGGGPAGKTDYYTFLISKKAGFTYAEVCQKDSNNDGKIDDADLAGCDCSYKKVLYANGENRYYAEKSAPPPTLMEYEVDPPGSSDPLDASLTKYKKKSEDTYLGWRGYCLEGDANPRVAMYQGAANKPCFTWWPVDTLQGEIGLFTNYPKAGFEVEKPYYCLAAAWQEYRSSYNIKTCSGLKRCSGPDSCGGNYTKTYTDSGWAGLTRYKRYRCDPIGGERWYPYDGTFDGNELYTGLKQVCTDIAQIGDTTDNKAWTSRVFDVPSGAFTIQPPPSTTPVIQYADPQKPYGAIPLFVGDPRTATEYVEIPAAPSAFKIYSPCDYSGVWQTCISNSFKNGYLSGPGADGAKVLERLFAKSYGVFAASIEGKTGGGICTGVCLGGQNPGSTCTRSEQCIVAASIPPITPAINYDCRPDICMGGKNAGLSCAKITTKVTGICDGGTCGPDGYCVGGTEDKQVCSKKGECAVDTRLYPQGICDQGTKRCVGGDLHDFPCEPTDPESCSVNQDAECTQSSATPGGATAACAHQGSVAGELSGRACVAGDPQFDCNPLGTCGIGDIVQPNGTRQKITAPYCSNKPISQPGQPNQCATLGGITDCAATGTTLIYSELPLANPKNWWDITKTEPAATPPVIAAVITRNGQPTEGPRNQVTINGESTGDLVGENGTLHASLRFYAYNENGNQMPLKKITVNWGGNIVAAPIEGRIQNHKNICRREKALVCAVDARCTSGDRTKPCAHADIVVDQMKLTSTACLRDTTTNVIQEGTPCTAYRSAGIPAGTGLCYRIDAKPAVNFGDSEDACVDDKDLYTPGYFVFNYDYTTPGTYTVSVTVEDNWGQKQTATYPGVITVPPVSKP
ncbi:hypothetical protein HY624_01300, partial [Candidatus Uhrbacteria bacterium]|nr:hypothetical protein [Candidatus Uhrbacteria bacterium]